LIFSDWLLLVLRCIVAGIFVSYGFSKLRDIEGFAKTIQHYNLVPKRISVGLAYVIPAIEVILGVLLFFNVEVVAVSSSLAVLLVVFSVALIKLAVSTSTRKKECGCSGKSSTTITQGLMRNFILLMIITAALILKVNNNVLSYEPLIIVIETSILVVITMRALQPTWLTQAIYSIKSSKITDTRLKNQPAMQVSNRRAFVRTVSALGLSSNALS